MIFFNQRKEEINKKNFLVNNLNALTKSIKKNMIEH